MSKPEHLGRGPTMRHEPDHTSRVIDTPPYRYSENIKKFNFESKILSNYAFSNGILLIVKQKWDIYHIRPGCELTEVIGFPSPKNWGSETLSGFPNGSGESISLLNLQWLLQGIQLETLSEKLGFQPCFWMSRKPGNSVISLHVLG